MLLSVAIKIVALVSVVLISGGVTYYFIQSPASQRGVEEQAYDHHECHHDEYIRDFELHVPEQEPSPIEATLHHEKKLREQHKPSYWTKMRILADYSNVAVAISIVGYILIQASVQSSATGIFLKTKLIPGIVSYLQSAMQVYPKTMIDELYNQPRCGNYNIPPTHQKSNVTGSDLVVYVGTVYDPDHFWFVRAGACILDRYTFRPVAGWIEFNTQLLGQINFSDVSDTRWLDWIQSSIHEMVHLLGFSSVLYPYYINPTNNQRLGAATFTSNTNGRGWLTMSSLVKKAQFYFACNTATGVPLENNGIEGPDPISSHFEKTTFGNEGMTASVYSDSLFSVFTFTLLESTGWYLPLYYQAQPFVWGLKEGCPIEQGQCSSADDEFCTRGQQGCSVDYMGIASCAFNEFLAPGCGFWQEDANLDCRFHTTKSDQIAKDTGGAIGGSSRCWITTLPKQAGYTVLQSGCFKSQCLDSGSVVQLTVGTKQYNCTSDFQVLNFKYGIYNTAFTCPEIKRFCDYENTCPNNCQGVGTCRGNYCDCWPGYVGTDCSQKI